MGLSIHYDLELPGTTSRKDVVKVLIHLRAFARAQPVARVSPIFTPTLHQLLREMPSHEADLERSFCQAAERNLYDVAVALERVEDRGRRAAIGFTAHPGRGCGAATFGFMRQGLTAAPEHFDKDLPWETWWWSASCETQYASIISIDHLIDCHLAVIHMLDEAARLGVNVTVADQAEYWETRSVQHLIQEVDRANGMMARLI